MTLTDRIIKVLYRIAPATNTEIAKSLKASPASVSGITCRLAKKQRLLRVKLVESQTDAWWYYVAKG